MFEYENPLTLPRIEDVDEFDFCDNRLMLVKVTDENRSALVNVALSMYLGESCKYCGKPYQTLDDLKDTVYAGYHEFWRLACKICWNANN